MLGSADDDAGASERQRQRLLLRRRRRQRRPGTEGGIILTRPPQLPKERLAVPELPPASPHGARRAAVDGPARLMSLQRPAWRT
jgi:hypothetical protein